jgi:hypothetical protein
MRNMSNVMAHRVGIIQPKADLSFTKSSVPAIAVSSGNISVTYEIANQGIAYQDCDGNMRNHADAAGPFVVKAWLSKNESVDASDVLLGTISHSGLNAYATSSTSSTLSIPPDISNGTYYVLFQADANGQVVEAEETANNIKSVRLYILNLNNLQPDCLELEDAVLAPDSGPSEERASAPASRSAEEKTEAFEVDAEIEWSVFPNPATDFVQFDLTLEESSDLDLQILDASGKILQAIHLPALSAGQYSERVGLQGIPSGVYFVHLQWKGKSATKKIVVQH